MALLLDEKNLKKLSGKKPRRPKRGKQVKPTAKPERLLRKRMEKLWETVLLPATEQIQAAIERGAPLTEIADLVERSINEATFAYGLQAREMVGTWSVSMDTETRHKFQAALGKTLGVDLTAVLDTPEISDALAIGVWQATNLIKTVPQEYFGEISKAVADNFHGKPLPNGRSLMQHISFVSGVSKKRARTIARDQTFKLTGNLNMVRQTSIGVEEYIWRTVKDNRVAGKPGGQNPPVPNMASSKFHGNHYERNGKKFRWDSPPPDGHPGQAILCRCWAEPVINLDKIVKSASLT